MTNPFPPGASQEDMLTIILDSFPATNLKGINATHVPIQPKTRRPWAQQLVRRGVVVHPELMTELPLQPAGQGGSSWFTPSRWVSREDYEKHVEQTSRPPAEQIAEFRERLRALDPAMVERIESMTDEERRAGMDAQMQHLAQAVEFVERIRGDLAKAEENPKDDA